MSSFVRATWPTYHRTNLSNIWQIFLNTIELLAKSKVFENIWNFLKNRHLCKISQKIHKNQAKKCLDSKKLRHFEILIAACQATIKRFTKKSWIIFTKFFPINDFIYTFLFFNSNFICLRTPNGSTAFNIVLKIPRRSIARKQNFIIRIISC